MMLLADTSVWIRHFRVGQPEFADHLSQGLVLTHPFVIGELACGNLKDRSTALADLGTLPRATPASEAEAMQFIEDRRLWGRGLGWIDMNLLASAVLTGCSLWTLDRRLAEAAGALDLVN